MRRNVGIGLAAAALAAVMAFGPAFAGSQTTGGEDSTFLDTATQWFLGQREAPNDYLNPAAYAALAGQASSLASILPITSAAFLVGLAIGIWKG